jgi:hypothetical protein
MTINQRSRVLLEELIKKVLNFYGTQRFTRAS